jgi:hypothetical protein
VLGLGLGRAPPWQNRSVVDSGGVELVLADFQTESMPVYANLTNRDLRAISMKSSARSHRGRTIPIPAPERAGSAMRGRLPVQLVIKGEQQKTELHRLLAERA